MKVSEPMATYGAQSINVLKDNLIASVKASKDEKKLQACMELLQAGDTPCRFTEEELDEEIRLAEVSGYAHQEDVEKMFQKWGVCVK